MINYMLTEQSLTVFTEEEDLVIHSNGAGWDAALTALREDDFDRLVTIMTPRVAVDTAIKASNGRLAIVDDNVTFDGEVLEKTYVVKKILRFAKQGLPVAPLLAFLTKLLLNPSFRIRRDLLEFLEKNNLPLTPDGNFLAYKYTKSDGFDQHTGNVHYPIGAYVTMPRDEVDDDPNHTCSAGLHVAGRSYFGNMDARFIVCDVDPRDVVSIPSEYNCSKMRVCGLVVRSEIQAPQRDNIWDSEVVSATDEEYDEIMYNDEDDWD